MDILLWVFAWLLVGCGVAWMIGAAASMSDAPIGKHASHQNLVGNIHRFSHGGRAQGDIAAELSATAGTDRRRLRGM
jgi:hypothetical protein